MAQYWLQTPIENAKEVVQRFINDNAVSLPGLVGMTASYTIQTEVIYYSGFMPAFDANTIYFGTFYITNANELAIQMIVNDGLGNSIGTFDGGNGIAPGQYPSIIWNDYNGVPESPGYFVGYKFTLS